MKSLVDSLEKRLAREKDLRKIRVEELEKKLKETGGDKTTALVLLSASCAFAVFSALFLLL